MKTKLMIPGILLLLICSIHADTFYPEPPYPSISMPKFLEWLQHIDMHINSVNTTLTDLKDQTIDEFSTTRQEILELESHRSRDLQSFKQDLKEMKTQLRNRQEEQYEQFNKKIDEQYYNLLITLIIVNVLFILLIRFIEQKRTPRDETVRIAEKFLELAKQEAKEK